MQEPGSLLYRLPGSEWDCLLEKRFAPMIARWKQSIIHLFPTIFLSVCGVVLILVQTRFGPGVNGDTVHYVMGAQNLLAGNGYSRNSGGGEILPITGFPPLFSSVLAGLGWLGMDVYDGARVLNAILFGANILLVGILIQRYTQSRWAAAIGSTLILVSSTQIEFHIMALSEPLFMFLMLLVIFCLAQYLDSYSLVLLVFSGIVACLATLTRYVGFSLIGAGGLSLILLSRESWKRRLSDLVLFWGITLLPIYFWFKRNADVSGTLTNRVLSFHLMDPKLVRVFIAETASWFTPRNLGLPRPVRNVLVGIIALPWPILFFFRELKDYFQRKEQPRRSFWTLPWILLFNIILIIGVLIINTTLLDAGTPVSAPPRYLTPVFASMVILFILIVYRLLEDIKLHSSFRIVPLLYAGMLIGLYGAQSMEIVKHPTSAIGYTGYKLARMDVVNELEALDPNLPIISNNPEMVFVFINRPAYMWPIQFDHYTLEDREDFEGQLEATEEKLRQGGVIVVFGWPGWTEELVFDYLHTERLSEFIDVTILGYPE